MPPGWNKQQLTKLACARHISTPFYLITDADTFYMTAVSATDLVESGTCEATSAVCDHKRTVSYRARNELALHTPSNESSNQQVTGHHPACRGLGASLETGPRWGL
jgi:Family of unknown function (DUF6492)